MIEKFYREEQKYFLTKKEYEILLHEINEHLMKDKYFHEKICNIYFDNEHDELVLKSLNKPLYKEKIRLRSYNVPTLDDNVFLEIKKKYNGVVNKRRIIITYKEALDYINNNIVPNTNPQIMKEIDYCFKKYKLKPRLSLTYDRDAYYVKDNKDLRITFDYNIKCSEEILKLDNLEHGKNFFENNYIMEIKTLNGLPNWFVKILSKLKIYPTSFSKYGEVYKKLKESEKYV
jgi:SPX domain protein involved in polyphosphate accumulation